MYTKKKKIIINGFESGFDILGRPWHILFIVDIITAMKMVNVYNVGIKYIGIYYT